MVTHKTLKWAALLFVAWGACGCGLLKSPTAADESVLHPNETLIIEYTQCYADYFHLGKITVYFWEFRDEIDCSDDHGEDVMCPISGRAYHKKMKVGYWGPWVRGETEFVPPALEWTAAHEVCHLTGIRDEAKAKQCVTTAWDLAECHEDGKQPVGINPRLVM